MRLLTVPVVISSPALHAQGNSTRLRIKLETRYAQPDSAIARRDFTAFLATLAPDYLVELRKGERFTRPGIDFGDRPGFASHPRCPAGFYRDRIPATPR